jgi:hypothetical protein
MVDVISAMRKASLETFPIPTKAVPEPMKPAQWGQGHGEVELGRERQSAGNTEFPEFGTEYRNRSLVGRKCKIFMMCRVLGMS